MNRIVCLELNPQSDLFLSSSKDQHLKLWDLCSNDQKPLGIINLTSKKATPIGNFDPSGVIFAIAFVDSNISGNSISQVNSIKLYDIERFSEVCLML